MMKFGIPAAVLFVAIFIVYSSTFILQEGQQALITEFGRIVGSPITSAGLHWKKPVIQDVRYFEKRILNWDGDPNQIPTKDKKYIIVDTTARWRIADPVKFAQTVQTEDGARNRLDAILDGATRDIISKHNLVEAVRNTNSILDRRKEAAAALTAADVTALLQVEEEEITGEIEPVAVGRERLSQIIIERARVEMSSLGIVLIDVQLRRIAYEQSVEAKVYERMTSERKRIAEKIRSIGKGEEAKINGKLNRDLKEIESKAYRQSQEIRGKAEAEAIAIYASVLEQDPDFYSFVRTLEAYKKTFPAKGNVIISTDSEFMTMMRRQ
jgi:membrane protease subunit HflC